MIIKDYNYPIDDDLKLPEYYKKYYPDSKLLFFDIETTGLSARNSTLYLIGALWYEDKCVNIRQWFNEDGYSEKELLKSFDNFCSDFTHLVDFNGSTFDVPYLNDKVRLLSLSDNSWAGLCHIDIYREIRSYRSILNMDSMKLVSIERFLGIARKDSFSGKDLINVYQRYVARPDEEKQRFLLLHNHDDLLGMPLISKILNYKVLFEDIDIVPDSIKAFVNDNKLMIEFELMPPCCLPKRFFNTDRNGIFINITDNKALMEIPVSDGTLKHYFKDYKNYYYLPLEDTAIHKSVAGFVDKENRTKATKDNCYIKKAGKYIICYDESYEEIFMIDRNDKKTYILLDTFMSCDPDSKISFIRNWFHIRKK